VRSDSRGRRSRAKATTSIDAQGARAKGGDLQQASRHGDVLEEMNQLVLIGEVVVEADGGGDAEDRQSEGGELRPKAEDQKD
jgi:hypothetical protein